MSNATPGTEVKSANTANNNTANKKHSGKTAGTFRSARDVAGRAAASARDAASNALEATQATARDAGRRVAKSAEENPVAVLAGGLVLGVLAAAALPRSEQEKELLAPVGKRLAETATGAVKAAKEAGKAELVTVGLGQGTANDKVGKLVGGLIQVLSAAGEAAANSSKTSGPR